MGTGASYDISLVLSCYNCCSNVPFSVTHNVSDEREREREREREMGTHTHTHTHTDADLSSSRHAQRRRKSEVSHARPRCNIPDSGLTVWNVDGGAKVDWREDIALDGVVCNARQHRKPSGAHGIPKDSVRQDACHHVAIMLEHAHPPTLTHAPTPTHRSSDERENSVPMKS